LEMNSRQLPTKFLWFPTKKIPRIFFCKFSLIPIFSLYLSISPICLSLYLYIFIYLLQCFSTWLRPKKFLILNKNKILID
jgi:hypothetical protein